MTVQKIQQIQIESPYSIGTIIAGPTAPVDGGTWLECNGSGVSQSTYSALYSAIGHAWTTYTATASSSTAPVTVANGTKIVWTGAKWLLIQVSNTQTYTSTDGQTWSAAGTLPGTMTQPTPTVGPSGTVVLRNNGVSATSYYTTNSGTSWSTTTNVSPISATGYMAYNGTNWLCFNQSSRNTYHTTNPTTGSWTTNTNALPAATGSNTSVIWDGTNWIINYAGTMPPSSTSPYYVTSVSTGASGWSTYVANIMKQGGAQAVTGAATNGSGTVLVASHANSFFYRTTNAFTNIKAVYPQGGFASSLKYPIYNGFSFIALDPSWGINSTSSDGLLWNAWASPINFLNMSSVNGYLMSINSGPGTVGAAIDPATGQFATISQMSGYQYSFLYAPATTLSTNFCLPSFMDGGKRWVKAL